LVESIASWSHYPRAGPSINSSGKIPLIHKNMQAELVAKGEPIPDWLKWRVEDFEAGRV